LLYSKHGYSHTRMPKLIKMNPHLWGRLVNSGRTHCWNCSKELPREGEVWSVKRSGRKKNHHKKYYCTPCGEMLNL